jgi:hypothetical protein
MIETFQDGGYMMWPLVVVTLGILWIGGRTAARLSGPGSRPEEAGRLMNMLLFWGTMGLVLGALGTTLGLVQMAQLVQQAGTVTGSMAAAGVRVTLITMVSGFVVFILAGLLWLPLHVWRRRLVERAGMR